ncbi:MAG: TonB-dependent receptor [Acidobacteria bacterium]|nr:TonB-dependent receptor [Acidobacteriota bacterium]
MRSVRFSQIAAVVAVLMLAGASSAWAQATIAGDVRDTSGGVLPGVTVEAASPVLIEKVRSVLTDARGQYSIVDLRPGAYTVTFTLPGFNTFKREGIELSGTFVATVNAELRVGGLEETITVSGESPIVDVQSTQRQQTLTRDVIDAVPTGNRYQNLLTVIPGVVVSGTQDVGGSRGDTPTDIAVHGSSINDGRIMIDGANVSPPAKQGGHDTMAILDTVNSQEVVVTTSGGLGEAQTGGITINIIPREGGNHFSGQFFFSGTTGALQASNATDELRAQGLREVNTVDKLWDVSMGFGGPILRDRLWFYSTARHNGFRNNVAGMYVNRNAFNPNAWTFDPDLSQQATNDGTWKMATVRTTWQVTPRNKLNVYWDEQHRCLNCIGGGTATQTVEATPSTPGYPNRTAQVMWKSPLTNRVLVQVGTSSYRLQTGSQQRPGEVSGQWLTPVQEQGGIIPGLNYRGFIHNTRERLSLHSLGSLSFVTGTHNLKVGVTRSDMSTQITSFSVNGLSYRFRNGVPNLITQFAHPSGPQTELDTLGFFAQDAWTLGRLSVLWGIRYDQHETSFPAQQLGPTSYTGTFEFPKEAPVKFHDITPRMGAAYDLFGTGKTAVKVHLGKYVVAQDGDSSVYGTATGRIGRIATSTTRSWADADRDYIPDCDLRSPVANGECGAMANRLFGTDQVQTTYDPDVIKGWGVRPYNWELAAEVTHELIPRVAVTAAYHRRWFGNFTVSDNLAVAPADFDPYTLVVTDSRLPGGGVTISDLYDVTPAKFGQVNNLITAASNFGEQQQQFDGVDLTLSARLPNSVTLQGGISHGTTMTDACDVIPKVDSPSRLYCHQEDTRTQLKFLGSYIVPRVDVLVGATFQSVAGPVVTADYAVPNALIAPSLGRPLAGARATDTVNLIEPFSMFGDRINQLDLRLAKVVTFGGRRAQFGIDFYNALNSSVVQTENPNFVPNGAWRRPSLILDARLIKFSGQLNF